MVLIIVMGGNVIVFFHGGVSLLTGIAHYSSISMQKAADARRAGYVLQLGVK